MRLVPLVLVLVAVQLNAAERPFDYPVASRTAEFKAVFTKVDYTDSQREGTKVAIKDRDGKTLFEHELERDVARNAGWSHDSKFLVSTIAAQCGNMFRVPFRSVLIYADDRALYMSFRAPAAGHVLHLQRA